MSSTYHKSSASVIHVLTSSKTYNIHNDGVEKTVESSASLKALEIEIGVRIVETDIFEEPRRV
jgi:hypothetical protein